MSQLRAVSESGTSVSALGIFAPSVARHETPPGGKDSAIIPSN